MVHRKRSHDEYLARSHVGMAETLSMLKSGDASKEVHSAFTSSEHNDNVGSDEWQTVESHRNKKRKKLPKKEGNNYPSISHSSQARLQSFVKISDLQNLVLYLLADGTSPQWCSVRHHGQVRKVVCLMVPGLESDMFNGKILLEAENETVKMTENGSIDHTGAHDEAHIGSEGAPLVQSEGKPKSSASGSSDSHSPQQGNRKLHISPDDYYPAELMYDRTPEPLQPLADIFEHIWPIKTPGEDRQNPRMHSPLAAMLTAPIPKTKEEKNRKGPQFPAEGKHWKNQRTPITDLLATTQELAEEGYVLHPAHFALASSVDIETARRETSKQTSARGWVDTANIPNLASGAVPDEQIEKGSVLRGRKVLAMDCEMCITSPKGVSPQIFSLTRVSVLDWDGKVVMDELVKPADPITDYLTPYSGITEQMLKDVTINLADIQAKLSSIITAQTVLIGHSLNSDLNALQMTHPFIIDTALLFPHPRGPPLKSALKWLSQKYLSREIQKGHGSVGHNSIEDAKACLDLVKQKCEKGKLWGTSEASGESIFKRLGRISRPKREKINPIGGEEFRTSAVIDWGEPSRGFGGSAKVAIGCQSDVEVVAGVKRAIDGDDDAFIVPRGGCDFIWARLRELEAHRGWWNKSKTVDNEALLSNTQASSSDLRGTISHTVSCIQEIYDALPPCTAFIVYSGSGDPRELCEMQALHQKFKEEYKVKKWDDLSVQWTDVEEQKRRAACEKARKGIGFVAVK